MAAVLISGLPSLALAQSDPRGAVVTASPSPEKAGCALHVWPSANAKSSYMGWFHGGAVDGDRRGIKGYPAMHADVLSSAVQQQLLTAIDWQNLLAKPGLSVVVHDQPPAPQDDQARTGPLIVDRPACYEELIIHSVLVENEALSAPSVRVMIIAKVWTGPTMPPTTYASMAAERVSLDGRDDAAIEASLKNGFVASVGKVLKSSYFQQH